MIEYISIFNREGGELEVNKEVAESYGVFAGQTVDDDKLFDDIMIHSAWEDPVVVLVALPEEK